MKPNFIVFMTDHQRGDTMLKNSKVITPNIDRLREYSLTFDNCYCPSPHCCPSRATFFSGLYPSEHGVWNNVSVSNTLSRKLFDSVRLFSEDLKENGYNLYFSGKWHVSEEKGPSDYGFEHIFHDYPYRKFPNEVETKEWDLYTKNGNTIDKGDEERTQARIVREGYRNYIQYGIDDSPYKDKEVAQAAVDCLDKIDESNPFLIYAGPLGPHDPYFVPQKFLDMYDINEIELPKSFDDDLLDKPHLYQRTKDRYDQLTREEHKECVRRFYAFCSYEDYLFGKILDKVEEKGLLENTVIIYVSDHGDYVGSHGLWAKGLPCFKEAYNVCAMVGGYGIKNPNRVNSSLVSLADFAPTILEMAGIKAERKFMGESLSSFLKDEQPKNWREDMYTQSNGNEVYGIQRCVFNKKWKYVFNAFDYDELYDLENDPNEMKNLIYGVKNFNDSEYGAVVREMCKKMWQFAYDNKDTCVNSYIMTAFAPYGPGIIFQQ